MFVSIAAKEKVAFHVVSNVLQFMKPSKIALHISEYISKKYYNPYSNDIVIMNHLHYKVKTNTILILLAHLKNFELLDSYMKNNDSFVLVASNQRAFRSCELSSPVSFSLGQTSDMWPPKWNYLRVPSVEWKKLKYRIHSDDDSFIQNNKWHADFVYFAKSSDILYKSPLTYMPHEGTFYPVFIIRAFLKSFGTLLFNKTTSFECLWKGSLCFIEEELLPTFVWQKFKTLAEYGIPPLTTRIWGARNWSHALSIFPQSDPRMKHVCSIKIPGIVNLYV